ncbi:MAG: class I SAM-dependent rRNA methyltransferase [Bacteroidales bacterium]|nr:class I SAM-dependent rRNA methyltransferase [Bacteroidales bacterium]MDY6427202.1 class I SAM-dependent rRNA methyltransferase [Bacteroidales bacterium]
MIKVFLRKGKEASLERFHPWVFSGAVAKMTGEPEEGEVVEVYSASGEFIAIGHYQIGSIAVRVLSFEKRAIDKAFIRERLTAAYNMRRTMNLDFSERNNTFRLVHGEGDFLPGLIIDIYGSTAVMQAHSVGMHLMRNLIAESIIEVFDGKVSCVFYKSETTLPYKADTGAEDGYLIGEDKIALATENGLKFLIDWEKGQKTGFFIDQRENRALVERYAHGRKVLNMFCYTGGFSCYAMRGDAKLVHSVDSSAKAIALTDKNIENNFGADSRHKSFAVDAFKFLDDMKQGEYDLIILDPPAFAKHRGALHNALQGYKRLNAKAFEKIKSGGILFTFSCSQVVDKEQFRLAVFSAAAMSRRKVRILNFLTQGADHPINIYHPEGEYLKGLVLYVE